MHRQVRRTNSSCNFTKGSFWRRCQVTTAVSFSGKGTWSYLDGKTCTADGGANLLSIQDPYEYAFIRTFMWSSQVTEDVWIGLMSQAVSHYALLGANCSSWNTCFLTRWIICRAQVCIARCLGLIFDGY